MRSREGTPEGNDVQVVQVASTDPLLDEVFHLYRRNSDTLGFLPRGAFEQFADDCGVLVACRSGEVEGYVAFRRSADAVVLVHLCVRKDSRGSGIATQLMTEFLEEISDAAYVRLHCRQDWEAQPT